MPVCNHRISNSLTVDKKVFFMDQDFVTFGGLVTYQLFLNLKIYLLAQMIPIVQKTNHLVIFRTIGII